MSARARSYHRLPQADTTTSPTIGGSVSSSSSCATDAAHVSAGNFDDESNNDTSDDRLDDVDDDDFDEDDERDALKKKMRTRTQRAAAWSNKMHALVWVLAAGIVAYAIDFFHVIFNDPRVKKNYFQVGLLCFGINTCITAYLAIYLPYIKRIHLEWSVYCPRMIPAATVVGVVATFSFIIALWPIWGLLTPGLLLLFFIGSLMTAHFLPSI